MPLFTDDPKYCTRQLSTGEMVVMTWVMVLLGAYASPPPATVKVGSSVAAALLATARLRVRTGWFEPDPRLSDRVQLVRLEFAVQPVPDISVAVRPSGRLAVTVRGPLEAVEPALLTVRVICPDAPRIQGKPAAELLTAKSIPVKNAVLPP